MVADRRPALGVADEVGYKKQASESKSKKRRADLASQATDGRTDSARDGLIS